MAVLEDVHVPQADEYAPALRAKAMAAEIEADIAAQQPHQQQPSSPNQESRRGSGTPRGAASASHRATSAHRRSRSITLDPHLQRGAEPDGQSPGGSAGGCSPSASAGASPTGTGRAAGAHSSSHRGYRELEARLRVLEIENKDLHEDIKRRQASYMRREDLLQTELVTLKEKLDRHRNEGLEGRTVPNMEELKRQMETGISGLLDQQTRQAASVEDSALKQFKQNLRDVEDQIQTERQHVGHEQQHLMLKLKQELKNTQDVAMKLDKAHKQSKEECLRLRAQFKCQEDDREYLIRQSLLVKKENEALKSTLERLRGELEALVAERSALEQRVAAAAPPTASERVGSAKARSRAGESSAGQQETDKAAYNELLTTMRKALETERARTKAARAAHTTALAGQTELQSLLRQIVEDIRCKKRAVVAAGGSEPAQGDSVASVQARPASAVLTRPVSARLHPFAQGAAAAAVDGSGAGPTARRPRPASASASVRGASSVYGPGSDHVKASARRFGAKRPNSATGSFGKSATVTRQDLDVASATSFATDLTFEERDAVVKELCTQQRVVELVQQAAFSGPVPASGAVNTASQAWMDNSAAHRKRLLNQALAKRTETGKKRTGEVISERTQSKPWVLHVDSMMQEFLSGR